MAGKVVRLFVARLGYEVHTPTSVFGRARLLETLEDEVWLMVAGHNGWAVFNRDVRLLELPHEVEAYRKAKVHMFLLPGQASQAQIVDLLRVNISHVCAVTTAREPGLYWLTPTGLEEYERRVRARDKRRERNRKKS
jgi:hypothetical protein